MFFQLARKTSPPTSPPFPASPDFGICFFPLSILVSTPSVLFFNSCEACHFTWHMQFLGTFSLYRKAFRMAFRPKKKALKSLTLRAGSISKSGAILRLKYFELQRKRQGLRKFSKSPAPISSFLDEAWLNLPAL